MRRFVVVIGAILLFFGLVAASGAGLVIIFRSTHRPVLLGWLLLITAFALATSTARFWSVVLPGIFAFGIVNCCFMLLSGHSIGQPDRPLQYPLAWTTMGFLMVGTVLAAKVVGSVKPLDSTDRIAFALLVPLISAVFVFDTNTIKGLAGAGIICTMCALLVRRAKAVRSAEPEK